MTQTAVTDRYGKKPVRAGRSRLIFIVLSVGVVIAGVFIAYIGYNRFTAKDVEGTQLAFTVVDNSTVSIRFSVVRDDPEKAAVCIIRARSRDGDETGRREVYIAPSNNKSVDYISQVTTVKPSAVGDVYGCSITVPSYLKTN